jgi:uncharacterized protein YaaQ
MFDNFRINFLAIVSVSSDQFPVLKTALNDQRFFFTVVEGDGRFISDQRVSLFIGLNKNRLDELIHLLKKYCRKRRVHIATQSQMEIYLQPHQPAIIEAEIGGASFLTIPVEYFEQY